MICDAFDVVAVPFPFVDSRRTKRRPAVALTAKGFNREGHCVFAMVTTKAHAPWPGDTEIQDFTAAGLNLSCLVRLKLFTLDNRLIAKKIGRLALKDRAALGASIREFMPGV